MKKHPRLAKFIIIAVALLAVMTLWAGEGFAVSDLAGQWQGTNRFTGISYQEATQKKVSPQDIETVLHFSADGQVTGHVGGAELSGKVIKAHRTLIWRLLRNKSNFLIQGQLAGAVAPGSASGTNAINAPFTFDGTGISGTLFAVYPFKYPYPFISLQLNR